MKTLPANKLAEIYELDSHTKESYFLYIVESFENGQRKQAYDLFNRMELNDKYNFIEYLIYGSEWLSDPVKIYILSTFLKKEI